VNELLNEVDRVIRSHGLLRRGQSVLVAVSGGLDSMVLLHLLGCLAEENRWRLTVAHLNHGLRGRSSDADERLVIRTAREMNLPVVTGRVDVEQEARNGRISIEMAAREVRHRFFARAAMERRIRTVALAHHQDDQVELFFLRLLRGSSTEGVGGMKWRSPSPASGRVQLVRPLLGCSRSDLMSYARAHRIRHREDASNATIDFQRNRIRHELLPLLQRFQPALNRVITRFMEVCASDADYVGTAAEQWLAASAGEFDRLHAAVQRRCIQRQLIRLGVEPAFDRIETLRTKPGQAVMVRPELTLRRGKDGRLEKVKTEAGGPAPGADRLKVALTGRSGRCRFAGAEIRWRISTSRGGAPPRRRTGREVFDADAVGSPIVLRHWQPGDRIQPIGMNRAVKLQDLFTNEKVPRERRRSLIVAATSAGDVVWVENMRISEQYKVKPATVRRLHWHWKR